jgi:hypothetical protein
MFTKLTVWWAAIRKIVVLSESVQQLWEAHRALHEEHAALEKAHNELLSAFTSQSTANAAAIERANMTALTALLQRAQRASSQGKHGLVLTPDDERQIANEAAAKMSEEELRQNSDMIAKTVPPNTLLF